ncbi:uncharacterized protein PHALS_09454 [Plasmopara halstedii]|uniref:Uncharacterized protein n=1 Tax=Plasmopara halstedii TaxID=4781 RepID=A0A0P1A551_PLAHL|nr:uncharacterized protein PHALS_09454 [Plasmopara halstedii]CEG35328.1 hypothetical protein PHALS_09454 [Plasmopara halstedii]|eukprot:XP_024571697.1 hypothetical protein PHALS_09454 [Plasmopara halstedii]
MWNDSLSPNDIVLIEGGCGPRANCNCSIGIPKALMSCMRCTTNLLLLVALVDGRVLLDRILCAD